MSGGQQPSASAEESCFATIDAHERYAGFSRVIVETVRLPTGEIVEREIVDHMDAVAVVAITTDRQVVLLRQYRQPSRQYLLEVPAGKLDVAGESPADAGLRELAEEAHHTATNMRPLTEFLNSAGWCTERTHLFLALNATPSSPPDGFVAQAEEADMEIVKMPFGDAVEMARRGELVDVKTALGLLLADAHLAGQGGRTG